MKTWRKKQLYTKQNTEADKRKKQFRDVYTKFTFSEETFEVLWTVDTILFRYSRYKWSAHISIMCIINAGDVWLTSDGLGIPRFYKILQQCYRSLCSFDTTEAWKIVDAWMMKIVVSTKWSKIYSLISVYNPINVYCRGRSYENVKSLYHEKPGT